MKLCDQFTALSTAQQPALFQESFKAQYFSYKARTEEEQTHIYIGKSSSSAASDFSQYAQSPKVAATPRSQRRSCRAQAYSQLRHLCFNPHPFALCSSLYNAQASSSSSTKGSKASIILLDVKLPHLQKHKLPSSVCLALKQNTGLLP